MRFSSQLRSGSRSMCSSLFFFNDTATTEIYTLSLHDALPICGQGLPARRRGRGEADDAGRRHRRLRPRSEEHTSELQSRSDLVCRLLLEKKKQATTSPPVHTARSAFTTLLRTATQVRQESHLS